MEATGSHDERDEIAALNNAEWCAAVWRSHGLRVERTLGLWSCPDPTPRFYPNVVTVERAASPAEQTAFIERLSRDSPDLSLSVKDSFSCLDLREAGLTPLFDARWLWRDGHGASGDIDKSRWRQIGDARDLAHWERAWRGADHDTRPIFLPELLLDGRATVLGEFDSDGAILAGGVVYAAAGVLGITNVFGSRDRFLRAVASLYPASPLVGYETGDDLKAAEEAGFQVIGPLRVWARPR